MEDMAPSAPDTVPAVWSGPFVGEIAGAAALRPGDVIDVPVEMLESAHWVAVDSEPAQESQVTRPAVATGATGAYGAGS